MGISTAATSFRCFWRRNRADASIIYSLHLHLLLQGHHMFSIREPVMPRIHPRRNLWNRKKIDPCEQMALHTNLHILSRSDKCMVKLARVTGTSPRSPRPQCSLTPRGTVGFLTPAESSRPNVAPSTQNARSSEFPGVPELAYSAVDVASVPFSVLSCFWE